MATRAGCHGVICGHTHHAAAEEAAVGYYNSGCWTEGAGTFLVVREGEVELHHGAAVEAGDLVAR
jgi:UDP-2,3-diacylglucosamine pyrophosphatase LpxH